MWTVLFIWRYWRECPESNPSDPNVVLSDSNNQSSGPNPGMSVLNNRSSELNSRVSDLKWNE
ncbi:hypothetical protein RST01_14640 [Rummeliibacillus stabekisii]|nr:hypothetical protein RST01_14640 [Rummeliibacillus stabekisii]